MLRSYVVYIVTLLLFTVQKRESALPIALPLWKFLRVRSRNLMPLTFDSLESMVAELDCTLFASIVISKLYCGVSAVSIENFSPVAKAGENLLQSFTWILTINLYLIILCVKESTMLFISEVFISPNHFVLHSGHSLVTVIIQIATSVIIQVEPSSKNTRLENFGEHFE